MIRLNSFVLLGFAQLINAQNEMVTPCLSASNTYTMKLNLNAEIGYYTIEECGDEVNPTIGMIVGETYNFIQEDRSNYYHPVGFAYFADGAHDGVDELEPGIKPRGSSSNCDETLSCPAPMYFLDDEYLGKYSNIIMDGVPEPTEGEDDFGLDNYEPLFFHPIPDWSGMGTFNVKLRFDVDDFEKDIFYFCHIHQFMSGRIKLLDEDRMQKQPFASDPIIPYTYDAPSRFDQMCGTFGLGDFQLPNDQCYSTYTCNVPSDRAIQNFAGCIDAMDCAMTVGMTTAATAESKVGLFINQMIPHHQNAINMAKALLKTGNVNCEDLTEESDECAMEQILWEIIGNQSFQIQQMKGVAGENNLPVVDDCIVSFDGRSAIIPNNGGGGGDGGGDMGDGGGDGGDGAGDMGDGAGDMGDGAGDMGDGAGDMGDGAGDMGDGAGDMGDGAGDMGDGAIDSDEEPPMMGKKGKKASKGRKKNSFVGDGAAGFF